MSESTQDLGTSVSQTLERTDLGHVINDNRRGIIIGGIVVLLAIVAFSIYQYQKSSTAEVQIVDAYHFEKDAVGVFLEGKMSSEELMKKFESLSPVAMKSQSILPAVLQSAERMMNEKDSANAIKLVGMYYENLKSNQFSHYFLGINFAAYLEDAGDSKKALDVLNTAMKAKFETLKDKVYFDIARLSLASGDEKNAKEKFDYVIKTYGESEYAKLAKLYLAGMNK